MRLGFAPSGVQIPEPPQVTAPSPQLRGGASAVRTAKGCSWPHPSPHSARPIRSLASFIWSVATFVYRAVVVTLVWPSTSWTTRICTPYSISKVAAVWRAS